MDHKVFISYSHRDKYFVNWLDDNLKKHSINTWYDSNEIKIGDSIKEKIKQGIEASSIIMLVLSKNSFKSEWVKYEFNSALLHNSIKKGIKIIMLKIDDFDIPPDFNGYSIFDLSSNRENGFNHLIDTINLFSAEHFFKINWNTINYKIFEDLVFDLLTDEGFSLSRTPKTRDGGIDFIATFKNSLETYDRILIQTKFYNNNKISIDILKQLYAISLTEKASKVLIITNSELTNSAREFISHSATTLIVWEEQKLLAKLYSCPKLMKKYFGSKPIKPPKQVALIDKKYHDMQKLIKDLDTCPEGQDGWKQYEETGVKILKHLFVPPLGEPRIQTRRQSGIDVRDAVFPNRSKSVNWQFIRDDYDAKYVLFEFKNFSISGREVDKQSVIQINDYLIKTIGRFGVICSNKEPTKSGIEKRRDIFIEANKLILFISNDHIKEMLRRKYKNLDPSDVIIDLIDDFNLNF